MRPRLDPPAIPRNGPCPCGSGKKFKKYHLLIDRAEAKAALEKMKEEYRERSRAAIRRREEAANSHTTNNTEEGSRQRARSHVGTSMWLMAMGGVLASTPMTPDRRKGK